jgi:bacteriorhodopsin
MELVFFITSVIFLGCATYFHGFARSKNIFDKTSSLILFTASAIYAYMGLIYLNDPYSMVRVFRYLDWVITVPLLLYQFFLFIRIYHRNPFDLISLIGLSVLMLIFGFLGEINYLPKLIALTLGTIPAIGIFYILFKKSKPIDHKFFKSMAILWLFYPIVYLLPETWVTLVSWSVVDILAKVGAGLYIKKKKSFKF